MKIRGKQRVLNGVDRLDTASSLLRGKRIGLLTNASGVDRNAVPTVDIIAGKYTLTTLFAPEHGIRTNLQDGLWGDDAKDPETGAKLVTVRHGDSEGLKAALEDIDVLVYDIQDVGARFYTYIYCLADLMRLCAEAGKEVVVLDRIDPIGGVGIEGIVLDTEKYSSGIGQFPIPTRYGLTVGEFAKFINREYGIGCRLNVVPCAGWDRRLFADDTDLLWVNPSPNITSVNCAINYIGTCIFEATNISEGRGTTRPFDLIGAPFVDSARLTQRMTSLKLDGVVFRRAFFTPKFGKYAGENCEGVELHIRDRAAYSPFETMLYLYRELSYYREFEAKEQSVCLRFGNDALCGEYVDPEAIIKASAEPLRAYMKKASAYLIY